MNLFRSEKHAKKWSGYKPGTDSAVLSLKQAMDLMSAPYFRERLNGHYISSFLILRQQWVEGIKKILPNDSFWEPPKRPDVAFH